MGKERERIESLLNKQWVAEPGPSEIITLDGEYVIEGQLEILEYIVDLHNADIKRPKKHVVQLEDSGWSMLHPQVCFNSELILGGWCPTYQYIAEAYMGPEDIPVEVPGRYYVEIIDGKPDFETYVEKEETG